MAVNRSDTPDNFRSAQIWLAGVVLVAVLGAAAVLFTGGTPERDRDLSADENVRPNDFEQALSEARASSGGDEGGEAPAERPAAPELGGDAERSDAEPAPDADG